MGRITRQKGLPYLLKALHLISKDIQVVLCAGAPDTPEIAEEVKNAFAKLDEERGNIVWIEEMLPKPELTRWSTAATLHLPEHLRAAGHREP